MILPNEGCDRRKVPEEPRCLISVAHETAMESNYSSGQGGAPEADCSSSSVPYQIHNLETVAEENEGLLLFTFGFNKGCGLGMLSGGSVWDLLLLKRLSVFGILHSLAEILLLMFGLRST